MSDDKKVININKKEADKLVEKENAPSPFERNNSGVLKATSIKNLVLILNGDRNLQNLFKFNEFTQEVDVVRDAKLRTNLGTLDIEKGQFTDQVTNSIELYIEASPNYDGTAFKNNLIDQAVMNVAHMNSYNPVIDYMNHAYTHWDQKRRLDKLFPEFLGAADDETNRLITRLWFLGAVAKIYDPTTKFDFVLDIVGGQGVGKTSLLQNIAPLGLYTDQFNSFTNKDDFEVMKNAVIVNDDEMTASNDAKFEEVKKFITMQVFEYRKSYARKAERFQKKFVMARTTNEIRHLKDRSGDRRFISIYCDKRRQKKNPVTDLTPEFVEQLWGEAVWLFKISKDPFLLSPKQDELLKENREQFRYTSGLEDELIDTLENKFKDQDFISNNDLSFAMFADENALNKNNKDTRDIRYFMEHLGYRVGARKVINGKQTRGFAKNS